MRLVHLSSVSVGGCRRIELTQTQRGVICMTCRNMDDDTFLDIYQYDGRNLSRLYSQWYADELTVENGYFAYENSMPETEPVIVELFKLEV